MHHQARSMGTARSCQRGRIGSATSFRPMRFPNMPTSCMPRCSEGVMGWKQLALDISTCLGRVRIRTGLMRQSFRVGFPPSKKVSRCRFTAMEKRAEISVMWVTPSRPTFLLEQQKIKKLLVRSLISLQEIK